MSSNLMFRMEEEEAMESGLWDPSAAFLWPSSSSGEESSESTSPAPMWANEPPPVTSNWNVIDEDTVLFGDYSNLGVDDLYAEGVIVESCLSSSNRGEGERAEREEEDQFCGDHEEEQVHFFDTTTCNGAAAVDVKKESNLLLVKIEAARGYTTESVVSTPDVVNDVITLESERLLRQQENGSHLIEIEGSSECVLEVVNDDYYEEYVVEYIDESQLLGGELCTKDPSSAGEGDTRAESRENSEFEDDDRDADYQPPEPQRRTRSRGSSISSSCGGYVKKRGRPAKPLRTHLTPRELANLEPEAKEHKVLRFKNNEASRLSRFKRRQKDLKLSEQCEMFESENKDLRRLLKSHKRLHKQFRALIVRIKISA